MIRLMSKLSEPIIAGSLNRSLKRFLLPLIECSRRDAGSVCKADTRLSARFWRPASVRYTLQ